METAPAGRAGMHSALSARLSTLSLIVPSDLTWSCARASVRPEGLLERAPR